MTTRAPMYRPLSGLVIRAPLLPAGDFAGFGERLDGDLARWWADPEVAFAVTVASPDLSAALAAAPSPARAPASARAALQRYLIRAATRPTPFGGFAGVGVARWAEHTDVAVAPRRRPTRTRPDMAWLTNVAERLSRDPSFRSGLRVYANTCALERDGRIYLADPGTGGIRAGPDVSVRASPVVRRVLTLARPGITGAELARQVLGDTDGATPAKVDRLLEQLCAQQFLLPEMLPALIGDPLAHVLKALDMAGAAVAAVEWSARLTAVEVACRDVDAAATTAAVAALQKVRRDLTAIGTPVLAAPAEMPGTTRAPRIDVAADVQLDSSLPLSGTGLAHTVAEDVVSAVDVLFRLHPNPRWAALSGYRSAFHQRYGDECRIPLLELLDPRFGLGPPAAHYGSHATDGLRSDGEAFDRRADTLRDLAATALRDGGEVVLDERLIEQLSLGEPDVGRLPPSVELSVLVAAGDRSAIDRGEYLLVVSPNLGAQAAGRWLGRFADVVGPAAHTLLAQAAAAETPMRADNVEAAVAELVYRPLNARSGNVAVRPLVREYELPIGVAPTLAPDRVVHLDELSVGLRDGKFVVWWDTANRPLTLAAGHMLNPATAPPVCRALLELTSDGTTAFPGFDWGPMAAMPSLPRVRYARVVLSPAQWQLRSADIDGPIECIDDRLGAWRTKWRVPRHVYLVNADNRLLLDLDDRSHQAQLGAAMKRESHGRLTVHEGLPGPDDGWLPGPRGPLMVELVVPLVRAGGAATAPAAADRHAPSSFAWAAAQRRRPPGSEWLYVTVDGPRRFEDELMAGSLGDLLDTVVSRGDADGWFFVRYADPDRQLRLRVHGIPDVLVGRVLPELTSWAASAIATGVRNRLGLEVYERELERFGGAVTTEICEEIACVDSSAVRGLLAVLRSTAAPEGLDRVELAVVSMADFLGSLTGRDSAERMKWAGRFGHGVTEAGAAFRARKPRVRALVQAADDDSWNGDGGLWGAAGRPVGALLARRRVALAPLVAALHTHWADGTGVQPPAELAASLVHLHANRLGLDRPAERLTLGVLDRTLRSLLAHRPVSPDDDPVGNPPWS